jgi:hypothetical protein
MTFEILVDNADNVTGIKANGTPNVANAEFNLNSALDLPNENVIINGCPADGSTTTYRIRLGGDGGGYIGADTGNGVTLSGASVKSAAIYISSAVSNLIFKPMIRLASVSDASFAPYSNICPISGRDSIVVDDTGRNIWDEQWELGKLNNSTGATESSSANIRSKNFIPVLPNTSLFYQIPLTSRDVFVFFYDANKNLISKIWTGGTPSAYNPYPTPPNCHYIKFYMETTYGTTYNNDICINVSDPTFNGQYVPYKGRNTVTIQLGTTVYGADINWDTGVMSITSVKIKGNSPTWTKHSTSINNVYITDTSESVKPSAHDTVTNSICSDYEHKSWDNLFVANAIGFAISNNGRFAIANPNIATLSAFETAIADADICYELATPTTIQLTPEQLQMLKGYNRVTIDNGSIEVGYIAKLT